MREKTGTPTPPEDNLPGQSRRHSTRRARILPGLVVTILVAAVALAAWMYLPALQESFAGTSTPTSLPPSPSASITITATPPPTAGPTLLPSATPMPPSAFQVDPFSLDPSVPGLVLEAVVLDDETNVTVEPPFDSLQWYSSEEISQQIGRIIAEPFYATIGSGSAIWRMDMLLQPGLYELFVMDTVNSSAGGLDFKVMLGERELTPLLGQQHVEYATQSGSPAQLMDEWTGIGLYELDNSGLLSIRTTWEAREMSTIVAIDRVLIVRQPDSLRTLLLELPANSPKYVVDDVGALIDSDAQWFTRSDLPAWGGEFQTVLNPEYNSLITWQVPGRVPPGFYDIWVWAPEMQGAVDLLYKVLVNGMENQGALIASTDNMPDNQWVSLGTWEATSPDGSYVQLGLRLDIVRGSSGEIGIDAAAFIYRQ